jgi:hypothetical protein
MRYWCIFNVELNLAAMDQMKQGCTKSEPGSAATGRRLKLLKNILVFRVVESLAGRCAPGSDFAPDRLKFKSMCISTRKATSPTPDRHLHCRASVCRRGMVAAVLRHV